MIKKILNLTILIVFSVSALVVFFQWAIIAPYEDIKISTNGVEEKYTYNTKEKILFSNDNHKRFFVKRKTRNTICIDMGLHSSIYVKDEFDVYHLVQESKVKYTKPKKIAILYMATGRYIKFWDDFYKSMEKHFLKRHDKTYFLFTDHDLLKVEDNVIKIHQDQLPWPYITFKRYHFFEKIEEQLKDFDYIYFLNGTMLAIDDINEDIFPTDEQGIMVTIHPGAWNKSKFSYTYDKNPKSKAYISPYEGKYYVMGGFNGGTSKGFLKLIKTIREWSDIDMKNNVMPLWHDESMLNRYLITYMNEGGKPLILLPEYAIPEVSSGYDLGEFESYKKMLILDKSRRGGHKFLRQE